MELTKLLVMIRNGHIFLTICCILYLIWWSITFNPLKTFPALPKYFLFVFMLITGILGGIFLICPLEQLPKEKGSISGMIIILAGIGAYFILLYLTSHLLHRQVTAELFLIIGWTVLELCELSGVYGAGAVTLKYALIQTFVVFIASIISMICYLAYYNLNPVAGFYDGMVPLVLAGIVMMIQAILLKTS